MDSLQNFLTHGAPLRAREARAGAPLKTRMTNIANIAKIANVTKFQT